MRDLVQSGGDSPAEKAPRPQPSPEPSPPPRERVRFPDSSGREAVAAGPAPAPGALGEDAEVVFAAVHAATGDLRNAIVRGEALPLQALEALAARVIESLEHGSELFWLADAPPPADTDFVSAHLARVGVLSVRIGVNLGYDRQQLGDLALAAFLFDIGLWQLPERLLEKTEPLTADEQVQYQTHPRLAADLIRRSNVQREGLIEAVLEHHEREQGQGYPQGLPGSAIHPHARIIGLTDTYARLIWPRPPRPRLQPHEAIREIVRSKHESFPSTLIKALLSEISVFPQRTMVKLNTGEIGRVVAVNRNHPLRPKVEVIADSKGERLHVPKVIDLSEAPFVYITGPLAAASR